MRKDVLNGLLARGFDTELIEKIDLNELNLTSLKNLSKPALIKMGFTDKEIEIIIDKVVRKPIHREILGNILEKSGGICCYCADGNSTRPFHIHHMDEYHISRNNEESNLALICPNHHSNVHSKNLTIIEQKATKSAWENLWNIALEYAKKGFSFPYGAFEIIDYSSAGNITDIFSFSSPKGSLCVKLSEGSLGDQSINTLKKEHKVILAGDSGSGKTTLAKGIAGQFLDYLVFKYVISDKTSKDMATEIFQFLNLSQKKIILIIDDANTKFQPEQIETILAIAEIDKKIILVNTRDTLTSAGNFEQHFYNCVEHISWGQMQTGATNVLIAHEAEIIEYFDEKGINNFNGQRIGYSPFDYRFNLLIEKYARDVATVWQFVYMLGGGVSRVDRLHTELHSSDRIDLIILFISIKQIAKVEEGSSKDEILEFFSRNSVLKQDPIPTKEWLNETLLELCEKRTLKKERDRYKTVHREFANKFIDVAFSKNRGQCIELLDEIFKDLKRTKEIIILWSWLRNSESKDYIIAWQATLTIDDWKFIADQAFKNGLGILSMLIDHLYSGTLGNHSKISHLILKDKAEEIANLIDKQENGTLYHFRTLSTTLKYYCREIIKPIMDKINQQKFADLIKNSSVKDFEYLEWLFSAIDEEYPEWIIEFSQNFSFQHLINILSRNEKGNIESVFTTVSFYRTYIHNIKRSEFRTIVGLVAFQLKHSSLEEIKFPILIQKGLYELIYLKDDVKHIIESMNLESLAREFEVATPRFWGSMLSISNLASPTNPNYMIDFVNSLNVQKVINNIQKYYQGNLHEFRLMIYQLCYGSIEKKKEFASGLQPIVQNSMSVFTDNQDHHDVLKAYFRLDQELCKEVCINLNKVIPEVEIEKLDIKEVQSYFEKLDELDEDYEME